MARCSACGNRSSFEVFATFSAAFLAAPRRTPVVFACGDHVDLVARRLKHELTGHHPRVYVRSAGSADGPGADTSDTPGRTFHQAPAENRKTDVDD